MFYIVEKLKGTPDIIKGGLKFGHDDVYDYFVVGCKTPSVKESYRANYTDRWDTYEQEYSRDDFLKQFKSISKRENFILTSRVF